VKESVVQKKLMDAIKESFPDAKVRKIHQSMYSQGGILDIVCCIKSKYVDIEVKTESGTLSRLQQRELAATSLAGGIGLTCYGQRGIKDVIQILRNETV